MRVVLYLLIVMDFKIKMERLKNLIVFCILNNCCVVCYGVKKI